MAVTNDKVIEQRPPSRTADVDPKVGEAFAERSGDQGEGHPKAGEHAEHSAGGVSSQDDNNDLGVVMLGGEADEPVGPEDALGQGPKRGDYVDRVGESNYHPHVSLPIPASERVPGGPISRLVPQRPFAEQVGEKAGVKGGVDTDESVVGRRA